MRTRSGAFAYAAATGAVLALAAGLVLLALNWSTPVPLGPIPVYRAPHGFLVLTLVAIAFTSVGLLVTSRHPANSIGWLYCVLGLLAGGELLGSQYATYGLLTAPGSLPGPEFGAWAYNWSAPAVASASSTFVLLLFPDGRLPSRAWRPVLWLAGSAVATGTVFVALTPGPLLVAVYVQNPLGIGATVGPLVAVGGVVLGLLMSAIALSVASLVARYRAADQGTRQQIKWIAYAAGLHAVAWAGYVPFVSLIGPEPVALIAATIPIATGIAILRYRLYDIDLLINRTLVYGSLSATLLGTYLLAVLGLSTLLRPLTGSSDIAVAGSTLAVVALFGPLRRRIQDAVDRRFSRSRYDAQRTVDAFSVRLRDQVDLDALSHELVGVVSDTVHPAHAGLWLREAKEAAVRGHG